MAQPVWVLSVDLQTKTATFQSGMAEAAKSARGAFTDIKSGSGEMGRGVSANMFEARHGVMLLGEEFGIKLPRALTAFITSIGPIGAAMEEAFPFLAIAVGATLLIQHLASLHAAGVKLTEEQVNFGIATQNAFRSLDEKLLEAGIKADELRHDHLGALQKQLQLINLQSMDALEKSFDDVAKRADSAFKEMATGWYSFFRGSAGAKASLESFGVEYRKLLSSGDTGGASALLAQKFDREKHILEMMKQMDEGHAESASGQTHESGIAKFTAAQNELKKMGVDLDKESVGSMQTLVDTLYEQVGAEQRINALKELNGASAKKSSANEGAEQTSAAAKAAAESAQRIAEQKLASDRALANAALSIQRASAEEREIVDVAFADRELAIRLAGNNAQIAALDKMAKDYPNQLKALHEKAEELEAQHAAAIVEINSKSLTEQAAKQLTDTEQALREKLEATEKGSAERLAAIDAAMKAEAALNLQDTANYRELLTQRVQTVRDMAQEQAKAQAEAGKLAADQSLKMGQLQLAAEKEHQTLLDSARRMTIQRRMDEELQAANAEYALKLSAGAQEIAALDKTGKDYENKLRELQNKQLQLIQEHENQVTAIKDKATSEQNQKEQTGLARLQDMTASALTQVLMGHKSFASQMDSIGNQVVSGMMHTALMSMLTADMSKEKEAASAARQFFLAGAKFPFPANIIMAPVLGAAAFASMMAFADGGIVPGYGNGDTVPTMLTPGEAVLPRSLSEGLMAAARSGTIGGGGQTVHVHHSPTYHVQTIDGDGIQGMLKQHGDEFVSHVHSELRKRNG